MLYALDTPGWKKVFEKDLIRGTLITRNEVMEAIAVAVPDHETQGGCEYFCSDGYVGLFKLVLGWFMLIRAECDGSLVPGTPFMLSPDFEALRKMLCFTDLERLGLETKGDREKNRKVVEGYQFV